ncbi:hypothetical protein [Nocardiopsis alba]|uniref:hypothetical protein n=1 Tax=Nocardiopsis alba TaxID=53437 RepID=UPI0035DD0F9F
MAYSDSDFPEALSVVVQTDPSPLVASGTKDSANRAGLSVLVTNVSDDEAVRAHAIQIQLKVSDDGIAKEDLLSETWSKRGATVTRQSSTRRPDRGDEGSGFYTFTYSGTDREEKPFEPGETVAVFVHDIPVSVMEGATAVAIGVQEEEGGEPAWKYIPLGKFPSGYYLRELRADTNPVEYGKAVKLTWLEPPIEGINYTLYANGEKVELNKEHPQPVVIPELTTDTTFELVPSWATDVRDKQRLLVRVMEGDVSPRNVFAHNILARSSLMVQDRAPLVKGDWHEFKSDGFYRYYFLPSVTGPIVTNFQFRPYAYRDEPPLFVVKVGEMRNWENYKVILNDGDERFMKYGIAHAYEGAWLEINGNFDKIKFRPAFAYI